MNYKRKKLQHTAQTELLVPRVPAYAVPAEQGSAAVEFPLQLW